MDGVVKAFSVKESKTTPPHPNGALSIKIPCSAISYANACAGKLLNSGPIPLVIMVTSIIITQGGHT